jgi:hypothetical protein
LTLSGDQPAKAWMKSAGWEEKRGSADAWQVKGGVLLTKQDGDSTMIGTAKGFPLDPDKHPRLRFEFKVDDFPAKGDVHRKNTEDSALRVFVVFDKGGGLLSPPDTLGYTVGSTERVGEIIASERYDQVKYLVVADAAGSKGEWVTIERDVAADYRKAFSSKSVPKVAALAIKSDANDTGGKVRAQVRSVIFDAR